MKWDAKQYQEQHNFSTDYGQGLFDWIPSTASRVLDIGCGTGDLTASLANLSDKIERVVGVDSSPDMIALARQNHADSTGKLSYLVKDASDLDFAEEFDVVYSNAAIHWISDQEGLLQGVRRALKPGGQFIAEFGGSGNVQKIMDAYESASGIPGGKKWFFPSEEEYTALLEENGLTPDKVILFERPTPLAPGPDGLENWVRQFYADDFAHLSKPEQQDIITQMESDLRDDLWGEEEGRWVADYCRIRIVASKGSEVM
jgi:ubiquinone/menaquinone biosynthesis C-methylase UbiE